MSVIRAVLINLLVLEFLAAIGIYALGVVKPDRRLDLFIEDQLNDIDNDYIVEYMTKAYDEHLGWNTRPLSSVTHKNAAGVDWVANYNETGARMPCVATMKLYSQVTEIPTRMEMELKMTQPGSVLWKIPYRRKSTISA